MNVPSLVTNDRTFQFYHYLRKQQKRTSTSTICTVQHSTDHQVPKGKEGDKGKQKGDSVAQTHNPYYSVPCAVMGVIYRCCRVMGYARTSCLFQHVRKGKCKSYMR